MIVKRQFAVIAGLTLLSMSGLCQQSEPKVPTSVAGSIKSVWTFIEHDFVSLADAMPGDKYGFAPSNGEFRDARTFAQQVKHVACANFGFFNQIEGKKPPADCHLGGPDPAKTKAELMKYLRNSFAYAGKVLATIDAKNQLDRVEGPYGGPNTKLGIATLAVWHASDHYGQ